jgi:nicotinamide riboside kinase
MKRILITGPESTGKSELALQLSNHYGGVMVEEYARKFIQDLGRPYQYEDVEHIALRQVEEYNGSSQSGWVFFDTWLIITRVWFKVVYKQIPSWLDEHIRKASFDLVILCDTDIPWIADPVRENGGSRREELLQSYKDELNHFSLNWELVSGLGPERLQRARWLIDNNITDGTT